MLNLFQHLTKSSTYETLKRVQGDRSGLFTRSLIFNFTICNLQLALLDQGSLNIPEEYDIFDRPLCGVKLF